MALGDFGVRVKFTVLCVSLHEIIQYQYQLYHFHTLSQFLYSFSVNSHNVSLYVNLSCTIFAF